MTSWRQRSLCKAFEVIECRKQRDYASLEKEIFDIREKYDSLEEEKRKLRKKTDMVVEKENWISKV